jgi:hypothetical protein
MATQPVLTKADLDRFNGSDHWYRHGVIRRITFTDGAKFVADRAGAYWLLDEIAFGQYVSYVKNEEFQCWKLRKNENHSATLTCDDRNGNIVFTKAIPFTNFPLDEITLWFENDVIYLPSER